MHVAYDDALAYAKWAGKRLPTEAEWEFAARGGLAGKPYVCGDQFRPHGKWMAKTHQRHFPNHDDAEGGFAGFTAVAKFPANGYGLYEMPATRGGGPATGTGLITMPGWLQWAGWHETQKDRVHPTIHQNRTSPSEYNAAARSLHRPILLALRCRHTWEKWQACLN